MPQNEQTDNSTIIPSKPKRSRHRSIANKEASGDQLIQRLLLVAKKFKIIGEIEPGKGQLFIPVNRLNAILRDFEKADIEPSALVVWVDDLINSQMLGCKEHKYINKDGLRSVDSDFFRRAFGKNLQKVYQKLRDSGIIKCDYKRGNKRAYRDSYVSADTINVYNQYIDKNTAIVIFNYEKISRRESKIIDKKRHNLESRNNRLFRTGQGNWGAMIEFFESLDFDLLSTKEVAKYQSDLMILMEIMTDKNTDYDETTSWVKYKKVHKITDSCNRAFCWSRDVSLSKETRRHFFDLPDIVNVDQPGSHLWIFHHIINHVDNHCLFLEQYLNDGSSFRSMVSGHVGVSQSTLKIILLSVLNGAELNRHGSIFRVLLSDGDDEIELKDFTETEIQGASTKLERFLDIAEGFIRCVQRWHQSIKDNPEAHQTLPKDILDGLSTTSMDCKTIVSFILTGYEQQSTLWWAAKAIKAGLTPLVNYHDGLLMKGTMPENFLTWGDDLLDIKMIEKPI